MQLWRIFPRVLAVLRYHAARFATACRLESQGLVVHPTALIHDPNKRVFVLGGRPSVGIQTVILVMDQAGGYVQHSKLEIDAGTTIGDHCNIRAAGGIISIGKNVMIANHVTIVAAGHGMELGTPMTEQKWPASPADVVIGSDVWVGAGVVLLPGTRIGDGAIIAAGAVVRGRVPDHLIYGGIPAKQISSRLPNAKPVEAGPDV